VGRSLAVAATVATSVLAAPGAKAGGLLVSDGNGVFRYNAITGAFVNQLDLSAGSPEGMALRADGTLYLSASSFNSILSHDAQTGAAIGTFISPDSGGLGLPQGLTFGPDGNLYVCSTATNQILRYNGQTGAFIDSFAHADNGVLSEPWGILFGPDGNLYVSSVGSNSILRYDGHTGTFLNSFVPVGSGGLSGPRGLAFGPDGSLFVSSRNNNRVLRYDGQTGAWTRIGVVAPDTTNFKDGSTSPNTAHIYRVRATNNYGASAWTEEKSATTPAAAPAAPTGLTGNALSSTEIALSWTDHSTNETAFAIWRKSGGDAWARIGVVVPNTTSFVDHSVSSGTAYTYRVRATNNYGASAWTSEAGAATP
jgi:streptogramin lyase